MISNHHSFVITLPDGAEINCNQSITGLKIAEQISISLSKKALAIKINGQLHDLSKEISSDASIEIITGNSLDGLEIIRHDTAHILAEAVQELYPGTQITIGPVIQDGFYYDFAREENFTLEDLSFIERKMEEIARRNEKIEREVWTKEQAIAFFKQNKEHYKVQIIENFPNGTEISVYKQGNFIDLCKGPHSPSTGSAKHFKLLKISGAYWRGDSNNPMLQRIYGTAWSTKEELNKYLERIAEAEKRDHRKLGKEMNLFHIQEEATGSVFWHPKGFAVFNILEQYIRSKLNKEGYQEIKTPILIDKVLWEKSGHWEKFRDDMFISESESKTLAIKPMSCPGHVQVFNHTTRSYRDLPIRFAEFGCCHRNESSGSLHGIMRVRAMTQDDAHIFCTEEQIASETISFCKLLTGIYKDFGFNDILIRFSDRPAKRAGDDVTWDKAEQALKDAITKAGFTYVLNPGEGAFYGPKLEFVLKDALDREWQCGTLQLDFVLPSRLGANYIDHEGSKKPPVMMHRAVLGTLERFIGILIEHYSGKFPLWLAPVQIVVCSIVGDSNDYATIVYNILANKGLRAELDIDNQTLNYKIRKHMMQKVPLLIVVGNKEKEENTISYREIDKNSQKTTTIDEFLQDHKFSYVC